MFPNSNTFSLANRPPRRAAQPGDVTGYISQGNPGGTPPVPYTPLQSDFINDLIDESRNLLAFAGLKFSPADQGQWLKAVQYVIYQPTITGGYGRISQMDGAGNGGRLYLNGSNVNGTSQGSAILDTNNAKFRVYTDNGQIGFSYDLAGYNLTVGNGSSGMIRCPGGFVCGSDANNNKVLYFGDANYKETGHVLQAGDGSIHISTGTKEVVIDGNADLTATSLATAPGGGVSGWHSNTGDATSYFTVGTGGIQTTGPVACATNIDFVGKNLTFYNPQQGAGLYNRVITAQMVYNDVTPQVGGLPQTEFWCLSATIWLDANGNAYTRAGFGTANTSVSKINVTAASEERLKDKIVPLSGELSLEALRAAPPISFNYKTDSGYDPSVRHVGNLYEQMRDSMPQTAVKVGGVGQLQHDKEVPYLQAVILMQAQQIEAIMARLAALEARV